MNVAFKDVLSIIIRKTIWRTEQRQDIVEQVVGWLKHKTLGSFLLPEVTNLNQTVTSLKVIKILKTYAIKYKDCSTDISRHKKDGNSYLISA